MEKELQNYAVDPMPVRGRVLEAINKWMKEKAKDAKSKGFFAKLREELKGIFFYSGIFYILVYFLFWYIFLIRLLV